MRKLFLALTLALTILPCQAQKAPRARDFNTVTDSLQQRLRRRTGVTSRFKIEKVSARGNALDFHFSQNMLGQPFRKGDINLDVWIHNALDSDNTAFYFESRGLGFRQQINPLQVGVNLRCRF